MESQRVRLPSSQTPPLHPSLLCMQCRIESPPCPARRGAPPPPMSVLQPRLKVVRKRAALRQGAGLQVHSLHKASSSSWLTCTIQGQLHSRLCPYQSAEGREHTAGWPG